MELTKEERIDLYNVLLDAFPDPESFETMVDIRLGKNPYQVAAGKKMSARVATLMRKAQSDWFLGLLLAEAPKANPGNETLRQVSERILQRLHQEAGLVAEDAGRIWYEAYKQKPQDENIRMGYSQYLLRAKRGEFSEKVLQGEPLAEVALQPQDKILPEQHSRAEYIDKMFKMLERLATT